jgi:hypothetical protein
VPMQEAQEIIREMAGPPGLASRNYCDNDAERTYAFWAPQSWFRLDNLSAVDIHNSSYHDMTGGSLSHRATKAGLSYKPLKLGFVGENG